MHDFPREPTKTKSGKLARAAVGTNFSATAASDTFQPFTHTGAINDFQCSFLIDTGAGCTIISEELAEKLDLDIFDTHHTLVGASRQWLPVVGRTAVEISLAEIRNARQEVFVVRGLTQPVLIGFDFLRVHGIVLNCAFGSVTCDRTARIGANPVTVTGISAASGNTTLPFHRPKQLIDTRIKGTHSIASQTILDDYQPFLPVPHQSTSQLNLEDVEISPPHTPIPCPSHIRPIPCSCLPTDLTEFRNPFHAVQPSTHAPTDQNPVKRTKERIGKNSSTDAHTISELSRKISPPVVETLKGKTTNTKSSDDLPPHIPVTVLRSTQVLPGHEMLVPVEVEGPYEVGLISPWYEDDQGEVVVAYSLIQSGGGTFVKVLNPWDYSVVMKSGSRIGTLEPLEEEAYFPCSNVNVDNPRPFPSRDENDIPRTRDDFLSTFDLSKTAFQGESRKLLEELLVEFQDIFSKHPLDLGCARSVRHNINTGLNPPVRSAPHRLSHENKKILMQEVKKMLHHDLIEESNSPWSSNLVLVRRPNGQVRVCCDLRKVNDLTVRDSLIPPSVQETLDSLAGSKYFSTFDFSSSYHQILLDEESRPKTSFTTPLGSFQYKRTPMGLKTSGSTLQRLLSHVFRKYNWRTLVVFVDDMIIFAPTLDLLMQRMREAFECVRDEGLKLRHDKSAIGMTELKFLGHVVSGEGIAVDPGKVEAVQKVRTPKDVLEVQTFVAMASYYRRYIKGFAKIAEPLINLSRKGVAFEWGPEQEEAFQRLKQCLLSTPILAYPIFSDDCPFRVDCDSSSYAVGSCLSQIQDGREVVIAYASATLSKAQRNWSTIDREMYALYYAVQHFKVYLQNRKFVLLSDHNPLTYLRKIKNPQGRHARMLLEMENFDYTVEYRKGKLHSNVDSLSRRPFASEAPQVLDIDQREPPVFHIQTIPNSRDILGFQSTRIFTSKRNIQGSSSQASAVQIEPLLNPSDISKHQTDDSLLTEVIRWFVIGTLPNQVDPCLLTYFKAFKDGSLSYVDGILRHTGRIVLPTTMIPLVLSKLHDDPFSGHFGFFKTRERIKTRFFWLHSDDDIRNWISTCEVCLSKKPPNRTIRAPLQPIPPQPYLDTWAADYVGPIQPSSPNGNSYVLVLTEYSTRWCEAIPVRSKLATELAQVLVSHIISRFGTFSRLITDQGRSFESQVMKELCSLLGIERVRTTAYHPQTDGLCERTHAILLQIVSLYVQQHPQDWEDFLPLALFAYRSSTHTTLGISPFRALYGVEPKLPLDTIFPAGPESQFPIINRIRDEISQIQPKLALRLQAAQQRQATQYDKKLFDPPLKEGDHVLLYNPAHIRGISQKLSSPWDPGYVVDEVILPVNYRISRDGCKTIVHRNRLRLLPPRYRHLRTNDKDFHDSDTEPDDRDYDNIPDHVDCTTGRLRRSPRHVSPPTRLTYERLGEPSDRKLYYR